MTATSHTDEIVESYLSHLDESLPHLAAARRRQIVEGVAQHIADGRAVLKPDDEIGLRLLLERIVDPEMIGDNAGGLARPAHHGDAWAPWLLLLGGFACLVGWFVGLYLLWSSDTWRLRDKLLGTFVLPGGLAGLVALFVTIPVPEAILLSALLLVAPIVTAVHLDRVRRHRVTLSRGMRAKRPMAER